MLRDRRRAARFVLLLGHGPLYVAFGRDARMIAGLVGAPLARLRVGLFRRTAMVWMTPEQADVVRRQLWVNGLPFAVAVETEEPQPTGEVGRVFIRISQEDDVREYRRWKEDVETRLSMAATADADARPAQA
jgi:hypothetical protein